MLLRLVVFSKAATLCIRAVYMVRLQEKMAAVASTSFLCHILRLPLEFVEQRMSGDIAEYLRSYKKPTRLIMMNYCTLLAFVGILSVAANLRNGTLMDMEII